MRKIEKGLRRAKLCVSIRRALLCAIQPTIQPTGTRGKLYQLQYKDQEIPAARLVAETESLPERS